MVARRAHNPKVTSSSLVPATNAHKQRGAHALRYRMRACEAGARWASHLGALVVEPSLRAWPAYTTDDTGLSQGSALERAPNPKLKIRTEPRAE